MDANVEFELFDGFDGFELFEGFESLLFFIPEGGPFRYEGCLKGLGGLFAVGQSSRKLH